MPSPTRASHGQNSCTAIFVQVRGSGAGCERASGEAIGIRRRVASLQAHLVRQQTLRPVDEKVGVKLDAAARLGVDLHHPSLESVRIELGIDRPVERAREINSPAVTAY